MEYYLGLKGKEILLHATRMNTEHIILSEVRPTQKTNTVRLHLRAISSSQIHRNRKYNGGYQGWEEGALGSCLMV